MKISTTLVAMLLLALIDVLNVHADEAADRLDAMLAELGALSTENYSVEGGAMYIVKPAGGDETEIVIVERIFRKTTVDSGRRERIDVRSEFDFGNKILEWDHFWRESKDRKYARARLARTNFPLVEVEGNSRDPKVPILKTNLICLPVHEMTGVMSPRGYDYLEMLSSFEVIGGKYIDGVFNGIYKSKSGLNVAWRIAFKQDPSWVPIECESYASEVDSWDRKKDSFEQLSLWKRINSTSSTWERNADGTWLPKTVRMYQYPILDEQEKNQAEFTLFGWKLGHNLDETMVSSESFVVEKLREFDFDSIRKRASAATRISVE